MSTTTTSTDDKKLRAALKEDPADWEVRKELAHLLYDRGSFQEAADLVWAADEIPGIDLELAFAARVLAKAAPRKSIRLLTAILELNQGKAVQNLGLANALLHHGMVLQAARFYGAALEADPSLGNPDLEHFILWTDDEETLWGDFKARKPKLGELPWMKRDPEEALKLTSAVSHHTSPVKVPNLKPVPGEELNNDLYQQAAEKGAQPSPPPAVTIPVDRVAEKDRLFDEELGAPAEPAVPKPKQAAETPVAAKQPAPAVPRPDAAPANPSPPPPSLDAAPASPAAKKLPKLTLPPAGAAAPGPRKLQFAKPSASAGDEDT
ncbi:hypothetical protein [Luteolibacter marinus]|uniref:hypothetical protein n=1 Tax=Luteolibacter marinus TaxID=2776705 RepID=UPI0018675D2C|nr:hypothetical protein [Luteolibacter marinus]